MKATFDRKSLLPKIQLEEKDIEDAALICAMMDTPAFKRLQEYWEVEKENIIDEIQISPKNNTEIMKTAFHGQELKGFKRATEKVLSMLRQRLYDYEESIKENNQNEESNFTDA